MTSAQPTAILILETDPAGSAPFYDIVGRFGFLLFYPTLDQLLSDQDNHPQRILLLDTVALQRAPTALVAQLVEQRGREPMALITDRPTEDYILDLRRWGLVQVIVKKAPLSALEIEAFLNAVRDPRSAFGLRSQLPDVQELCEIPVRSLQEKNFAVEAVINYFATANFDIHDLYDVRLILEESLNNSFYHAFLDEDGREKYSINTFKGLEAGDEVHIQYGANEATAGFTVWDNAGTLSVRTILNKLERQFNREGLFDVSGRGLHLSRMLSTSYIINLEEGHRTEVIALFDERRRSGRPKPLIINVVGSDDFEEWRLDADLD